MAAITICSDFGAQKNSLTLFPLFPHLFPMKWWGQMPWSSFSECWALSQLFHSPLWLSSRGFLVPLHMYIFFIVVQLLTCVWLFGILWTAARQAPLSFTVSWSLLKFMSLESVMLSNHLIHCCPFLLLPSIFPSIYMYIYQAKDPDIYIYHICIIHTHIYILFQILSPYRLLQDTEYVYSVYILIYIYTLCHTGGPSCLPIFI